MDTTKLSKIKRLTTTKLSPASLKQHISEMLDNSSHCRAILECVNHDTGEYRIVLHGILENNLEKSE